MKRANVLGGLLLAVAVALGAVREFLFVNLNYELDFLEHHRDRTYALSMFRSWVHGWDASDLRLCKWLLSLGFMAAILGLTIAVARVRFGHHQYGRPIALTFLVIGSLALLFHALAGWSPPLEAVSIKLLHALQYPVPLLVVWAASWRRTA